MQFIVRKILLVLLVALIAAIFETLENKSPLIGLRLLKITLIYFPLALVVLIVVGNPTFNTLRRKGFGNTAAIMMSSVAASIVSIATSLLLSVWIISMISSSIFSELLYSTQLSVIAVVGWFLSWLACYLVYAKYGSN